MKKIVMIPLDDRPCNYKYPTLLPKEDYEIILPLKECMPKEKKEANHEKLEKWLLSNVKDAQVLIISMDTFVLGGLVPSRLHNHSYNELVSRIDIIKRIREINKDIIIYGFELIMRCPDYSLSAEEPDYYAICGKEIHRLGELRHLAQLNKLTDDELKEKEELEFSIKKEYIDDYLNRREINLNVLLKTLELVNDGLFDYFIVPQDDASVYGFTALDQIRVRKYIKDNYLHTKVSMYPSADDVGLSLISKAVSTLNNYSPKVFVKYSSPLAPYSIPWFEDRMQDETIKYQIISAGATRVYSFDEADIVLCVNMVSKMLNKDDPDFVRVYDIERNLSEFINYIKYVHNNKRIVSVADTSFCNGSDIEFIKLLSKENLLFNIDSYAGWNTSSNTIGTTLPTSVLYFFGKDEVGKIKFLAFRYLEDYCYMDYARERVTVNVLPKYNLDKYNLGDMTSAIEKEVYKELHNVIDKELPILNKYIKDFKVTLPWKRMFECELEIEYEV